MDGFMAKKNSGSDVVIVSAFRTAIGNLNGSLSALPAHSLGEAVIRKNLEFTKVRPEEISEVIMGQVLTGAVGQNPARQASMAAGIPKEIPAWGVNQVCGSGLKAIIQGYYAIALGSSRIVIAGGQESMSRAPHATNVRLGIKMGDAKLVDTLLNDGLTDAFYSIHMGITAENIAAKFSISREEQDRFAVASQNKAEAAQNAGLFKDEIVPIRVQLGKDEISFENDEFIRHNTTYEGVAKLKPAFKKDGTVTAANSSGVNDGAAAVLLMSRDEANKRGLEVLGTITSFAQAGVDPAIMGIGPIRASLKALEMVEWEIHNLDLIEANEAFAAQAVCVNQQMGWDINKVNVNGGAIALGHPIGASGARILTTLLHEMRRRDAKKGIATLCIGGGMGLAMCIER